MKKLIPIILCSIFLVACAKSGGDEFVGKWTDVKDNKHSLQIVKNGDSFIVQSNSVYFGERKHPATFKDGVLQIGSGLGSETLTIDKSSGHLLNGRSEFERTGNNADSKQ